VDNYKWAIRTGFHRAADTYEGAALFQREVCNQLLEFSEAYPAVTRVERILDAGCGTGYAIPMLYGRFPRARCFALDFAPGMLREIRRPGGPCYRICGDIEHLPIPDRSIDLVWSSLALQWCSPLIALSEIARILAPGGTTWIATLGNRTLHELRDAFAAVDEGEHVAHFPCADSWLAEVRSAGLDVLNFTNRLHRVYGVDLRSLLRDLKAIGANQVGARHRGQFLGKESWRAVEERYEKYRCSDGLLSSTYDLIFLALRKPA